MIHGRENGLNGVSFAFVRFFSALEKINNKDNFVIFLFLPQPAQTKAWKRHQSFKTKSKGLPYLSPGGDFTVKCFLSSKCQFINRNTLQQFARFSEGSFREKTALVGLRWGRTHSQSCAAESWARWMWKEKRTKSDNSRRGKKNKNKINLSFGKRQRGDHC